MKKIVLALFTACAMLPASAQSEHNFEAAKNLDIFNALYKELDLYYVDTLDAQKLVRAAIDGMLDELDPYTEFYSAKTREDLKQMATGKYAGIGAFIQYNKKTDRCVIGDPFEGMPAAEAGLRPGDVILSIDGKDTGVRGDRDAGDYSQSVSDALRGEPGSSFEIRVQRPGTAEPLTLTLVRRTIAVPAITYYGMVDATTGYILLSEYTENCARNVRRAVVDLKQQGMTRLILPGFSVSDYSISFDAGLSVSGLLPVYYTLGADVTRARYAVYEGTLSEAAAQEKAEGIADGTETAQVEEISAETSGSPDPGDPYLEISGLETGVYTLVSANYGAASKDGASDEYKDFSYVTFCYIAEGDDVPVVLDMELNVTDKYQAEGHTSENSLEMYVAGADIEEAYMILERGDYTEMEASDLEMMFQEQINYGLIEPVDDETLAAINSDGYLDVASGLVPGTEYSLLVYAGNGYRWDVKVISATTAGEYDVLADSFTAYDLIPVTAASELYGTYDYYGVDLSGKTGEREKIGTVTIGEGSDGLVSVEGLLGPAASEAGVDDVLPFAFDGEYGVLGSLFTAFDTEYLVDGKIPLHLGTGFYDMNNGVISWLDSPDDQLLWGGKVDAAGNVLALVDSGAYGDYPGASGEPYSCSGIGLVGYDSEEYFLSVKNLSGYIDVILVRSGSAGTESGGDTEPGTLSMRNCLVPAGIDCAARDAAGVSFSVSARKGTAPHRTRTAATSVSVR